MIFLYGLPFQFHSLKNRVQRMAIVACQLSISIWSMNDDNKAFNLCCTETHTKCSGKFQYVGCIHNTENNIYHDIGIKY